MEVIAYYGRLLNIAQVQTFYRTSRFLTVIEV